MYEVKKRLDNCFDETYLTAVNAVLLLWSTSTNNVLYILDEQGGEATLEQLKKFDKWILLDTLEQDLALLNNASLIRYSDGKYYLNTLMVTELVTILENFKKFAKKPDSQLLLRQIKYLLDVTKKV